MDMENRNDLLLGLNALARKAGRDGAVNTGVLSTGPLRSKALTPQTPGLLLADSTVLSNSSNGLS